MKKYKHLLIIIVYLTCIIIIILSYDTHYTFNHEKYTHIPALLVVQGWAFSNNCDVRKKDIAFPELIQRAQASGIVVLSSVWNITVSCSPIPVVRWFVKRSHVGFGWLFNNDWLIETEKFSWNCELFCEHKSTVKQSWQVGPVINNLNNNLINYHQQLAGWN